ncbi:hypothetical protein B0I35DRAFT_275885 [Stachybotrys elegans]|uniref:Abscission/NoCut checkpoint regulator n=1 Tax=Stachybotrys elegans TaxID=80388 RepID=A0A8K0SPI2_9HYPO|nr:hypothetical protein B0I35DRAFT_275885 [Stachybotrys elegans]
MPNDVDKSLLDRLQALRGSAVAPSQATPKSTQIDLIQRAKTPTREDALAARLKSLRNADVASPSPSISSSPKAAQSPTPARKPSSSRIPPERKADDDVDAMFQTDDQTLEELLGSEANAPPMEPRDEDVRALLEELSQAVPKDDAASGLPREREHQGDSDDSDGERMSKEVDSVIARFQDEVELDKALARDSPDTPPTLQDDAASEPVDSLTLPSVPSDPTDLPSVPQSSSLDDITARLAALRASSSSPSLPSVPTSKPSGKPVNRLTSRTNYTDDDVDSWCTVCLEDATLRCLGCDGDPYCVRCWREMHVGPAAAFDDRSHKAMQFNRDTKKEEKKVALGA